jgi:arginine-tRNA-protein transferase
MFEPKSKQMDIEILEAGPNGFRGEYLDEQLAKGFYRDGLRMYKSDQEFDGYYGRSPMYNWVIRVRYPLPAYRPNKVIRNIRNRCAGFEKVIKSLDVTEELEGLYLKYKGSVDFEMPETLLMYLNDGVMVSPFNTWVYEVRDKGKLIGAGFFDKGSDSGMGVLNIYDPDYTRYSIGKFLIDQKMVLLRSEGFRYFYLGKVKIVSDRLDYKLNFDRAHAETYLSEDNIWVLFNDYGKSGMEKYLFKNVLGLDLDELFSEKDHPEGLNIPGLNED